MADAGASLHAAMRRESVGDIMRDAGDLGTEVLASYSAGERALLAEVTRGISAERSSSLGGEWSIVGSGFESHVAEADGQAGVQDSLESVRSWWRNIPSVVTWTAGIGPAPGSFAATSTSMVASDGTPQIGIMQPANLVTSAEDDTRVPSKWPAAFDAAAAAQWLESALRDVSLQSGKLIRGRLLLVALALLTLLAIPAEDRTHRTVVCVTSNSDAILDWAMALGEKEGWKGKIRLRRLMTVLDEDIKLDSKDEMALKPKSPAVRWPFSWFQEAPCDKVVIIVRAAQLASGRNPLHKYSSKTKTRLLLEHAETTLAVVNGTCEGTIHVAPSFEGGGRSSPPSVGR